MCKAEPAKQSYSQTAGQTGKTAEGVCSGCSNICFVSGKWPKAQEMVNKHGQDVNELTKHPIIYFQEQGKVNSKTLWHN